MGLQIAEQVPCCWILMDRVRTERGGRWKQLLSIINANTEVQPKTLGTIISQVMKMENRQQRKRGVLSCGCLELSKTKPDPPPNTSTGWRHTLPVLVSKLQNPQIICGDFDTEGNEGLHTLISGWMANRTIKDTEGK